MKKGRRRGKTGVGIIFNEKQTHSHTHTHESSFITWRSRQRDSFSCSSCSGLTRPKHAAHGTGHVATLYRDTFRVAPEQFPERLLTRRAPIVVPATCRTAGLSTTCFCSVHNMSCYVRSMRSIKNFYVPCVGREAKCLSILRRRRRRKKRRLNSLTGERETSNNEERGRGKD